MTRKSLTWMLIAVAVTVWLGCSRREKTAEGTDARTISAPEPQPEATGTDAMTQTVDIESGRSENEGGVLTSPNPPIRTGGSSSTATTGTTATTTTTTTAKPKP